MDIKAQRSKALRLAVAAGAEKTQAAIKDESSCYEDIFKTAIQEAGLDAVVDRVLASNPEWASEMLQHIPDLDDHRDALLKKAATSPAAALNTLRFVDDLGDHQQTLVLAAGTGAVSQGNISAIHLKDSAGFNCKFTMFWTNAGVPQPQTGVPNQDQWVWSSELMLGQSTTMACRNFSLANAPLAPGDDVWIYVRVLSGDKHTVSPLRFTYDPNTVNCAVFTISGTTTDNSVGFSQITAAAPMVQVSIDSNSQATCSPDEVVVKRNSDTGVQWHMKTPGWVFTGIEIANDTGHDFGTPAFNSDQTVMTVTDSVADLGDFTYCVNYKNAATGEAHSFDPGIKNID